MGKCGNFAKTVGEVSPKSHLHFFTVFTGEKKGIKNGQIGRKFPYGGGRGRGLPYFFLLLN